MLNQNDYADADKCVTINKGDKDLTPIVIKLPKPPDYDLIDGYGLDPKENFFRRHELPQPLKNLEELAKENVRSQARKNSAKRVTNWAVHDEFWDLLYDDRERYYEEIKYIKKVWWHLYYGYWFFCYDPHLKKSKPVWITPWHYRFLNFWYMDTGSHYPDYRDVDRRNHVYKWYLYATHETFKNINKDGYGVPNSDGTFDMVELPHRTFFGPIKPKRRREGASHNGANEGRDIAGKYELANCVIVADTGKSSRDIYENNFLPAWKHEPLFLKPITDSEDGSMNIKFESRFSKYKDKTLGSKISFADTAAEGVVDRLKTKFVFFDESAKVSRYSAWDRHEVSKPTAAQGFDIHGFLAYYSTVEEMNEGGADFEKMFNMSNFYKRHHISGQTDTGLGSMFNPAPDGKDGFIDKWGWSVIKTPTDEQINYAPSKSDFVHMHMGAEETLQKVYDMLLADGSPNALALYRQKIRKDPMCVADCWIGTAGEMGWDLVKVEDRIPKLKRKPETRRINFKWSDGRDSKVAWYSDEDNGKFIVSDLFLNKPNNQWTYEPQPFFYYNTGEYIQSRMPVNSMFTAATDTFGFRNESEAQLDEERIKLSKGGFSMVYNHDPFVDDSVVMSDWDSYKLVLTYENRLASQYEFWEDTLMACVYFGAMNLIERNKDDCLKYYMERGYHGYLKYLQKPDGSFHEQPGVYAQTGTIDSALLAVSDYVAAKCHKESHLEFLMWLKQIRSKKELTKYDGLMATAWALWGSQHAHGKHIQRFKNDGVDISKLFRTFSYK